MMLSQNFFKLEASLVKGQSLQKKKIRKGEKKRPKDVYVLGHYQFLKAHGFPLPTVRSHKTVCCRRLLFIYGLQILITALTFKFQYLQLLAAGFAPWRVCPHQILSHID